MAAAAGLVAALLVLAGVASGGVEDNGDGFRLSCGLGLVPDTADGLAAWKGGVVTAFTATGAPTCAESVPSVAAPVLWAATRDGALHLADVGAWYAGLTGLVVALGALAASAGRLRRAAVVAVPVAPLALPVFTRFAASTYAEPAGLLGILAAACGVAALLVRRGRSVLALVLTAGGGVVAVAAKVALLPVFLVAVAVVVAVLGRRAGTVVAVVCGLVVTPAIVAALRFQAIAYGPANAHDVVFTLVLPEVGPSAATALGLPPEAVALTGTGFFNGPPLPTAPWWRAAVLDAPEATRLRAHAVLAAHPGAALRAVGTGLTATLRPDLPYLSSGPADPARPSARSGDPGWSGASAPAFRAVLDATPVPWLPAVVVGIALAPGRRRTPWSRAAGLAALTALGLVVAALLGDGYFELFKHVWAASYLLVVAALCLIGGGCRAARDAVARRAGAAAPRAAGSGSC